MTITNVDGVNSDRGSDACVRCGRARAGGQVPASQYCRRCLHWLAPRLHRSIDEFCQLAELVASVAESYGVAEWRTIEVSAQAYGFEQEVLLKAAKHVTEHGLHLKLPRQPTSDEILAERVSSVLGPEYWTTIAWLDSTLATLLVGYALRMPNQSLFALLVRLHRRPKDRVDLAHRRWIRHALLGVNINRHRLREEPYCSRLRAVGALPFAHGVLRIARYAGQLEQGSPPADAYSPDERLLLGMLFPENIRRYKRANDYFQTAADSVRQRNDAADRLLDLWLLNPVSPRLSRYMSMLYHAYIEGRQAETVILSRTVLERAVSDAGGSHNATANSSMNARITQLLNRGRLSREAAADARAIWHRGNKVIHEDADFDVDAFDTIRCLLHILTELRTEIAG